MIINKDLINNCNVDNEAKEKFSYWHKKDISLEQFLCTNAINFNHKISIISELFTYKQNLLLSLKCINSILYILKKEYPDDNRFNSALNHFSDFIKNLSLYQKSTEEIKWKFTPYCAFTGTLHRKNDCVDRAVSSFVACIWNTVNPTASEKCVSFAVQASVYDTQSMLEARLKQVLQQELTLKFILDVYNETK